jgi:hypothetical protein
VSIVNRFLSLLIGRLGLMISFVVEVEEKKDAVAEGGGEAAETRTVTARSCRRVRLILQQLFRRSSRAAAAVVVAEADIFIIASKASSKGRRMVDRKEEERVSRQRPAPKWSVRRAEDRERSLMGDGVRIV